MELEPKYRLYENDDLVGIVSLKEAAGILGTSYETIKKYTGGKLYKKTFRLERVYVQNSAKEERAKRRILAKYDWENLRKLLNPKARD